MFQRGFQAIKETISGLN